MSRMPLMTREGRRKRQQAWQMGQEWASKEMYHQDLIEAFDSRDEQVEFLRGIGQWFNGKAHELATQEEP